MKLYYAPLACSLAAHITCLEADLPVSLRSVALRSKEVSGEENLRQLSPMGKVPTLVTDDGVVLTESAAVLLYLADRAPGSGLAPRAESAERYQLMRWLSFVGTELHRRVAAPIFALDAPPDAVREYARKAADQPLSVIEAHLGERPTLLGGDTFTVADAYLFWVLTVLPAGGVSLEKYPAVRAYQAKHGARPAVRRALKIESAEYAAAPYGPSP